MINREGQIWEWFFDGLDNPSCIVLILISEGSSNKKEIFHKVFDFNDAQNSSELETWVEYCDDPWGHDTNYMRQL